MTKSTKPPTSRPQPRTEAKELSPVETEKTPVDVDGPPADGELPDTELEAVAGGTGRLAIAPALRVAPINPVRVGVGPGPQVGGLPDGDIAFCYANYLG